MRPRSNKYRWLILAIFIILIFLLIKNINQNTQTQIQSLVKINLFSQNKQPETKEDQLKEVVEKAMSGAKGRYGIVVENFKTKETYLANEHQIFEPGSLYKLWVMAATFQQIKDGSLTEDQTLSQDVATLNKKFHIDDEAAELAEGKVEMTVAQALDQMITISHNYAALLLSEKLKNSKIAEFLTQQGFKESFISNSDENPKTTPADVAYFYKKLYLGELVDAQSSQKMVELLQKQELNDGLPKYLAKDIVVAHKTGDIGWFKHDAGIVYTPNGDYLLVVLSESNYPPGAQERIAQLSRALYNYFAKKG